MRLRNTPTGRVCASDPGITLDRIVHADPPGTRRQSGWIVHVRRDGRLPLRHQARTLPEAVNWARRHWEPDFMREVKDALAAVHAHLYRQAVDEGDTLTFRALLDAAEEAGARLNRDSLLGRAQAERLLPVTDAEGEDRESPMPCHCCRQDAALVRRVGIRGDVDAIPAEGFSSPDDPAYIAYEEACTYRAAFVCLDCYRILDSISGRGRIGGQVFNIDGRSRNGRATLYDKAKYAAYQKRRGGGETG